MGISEVKEGTEEIFEATKADKFPKLMTDPKAQIQEARKIPRKINKQQKIYTQAYFTQMTENQRQ